MSGPRPAFFRPLAMTWAEAAQVAFRRSESWLRSNIDKIDGFPRPDAYGLFAAEAVETWFRRRHGLVKDAADPKDAEAALLEKINAKCSFREPSERVVALEHRVEVRKRPWQKGTRPLAAPIPAIKFRIQRFGLFDGFRDRIRQPPRQKPGSAQLCAGFPVPEGFPVKLLSDQIPDADTKRDYCYSIKTALGDFGGEQVTAITRRVVKDWYRAIRDARGPSAARNAAAALRRLLSFATDEGWIHTNPALKMRITTPDSRERVWSTAERDAFAAAAKKEGRPSMALAVMLGWCLGQRPADLRTLSWAAYDGKGLHIHQAKRGARIWVPALPELRQAIQGEQLSERVRRYPAGRWPAQRSAVPGSAPNPGDGSGCRRLHG